ncbi:MAG: hypothetical protein JWR07_483 [Nevskia sp.]|nr:hypothetical protein [Nevskia sp.]
MSFLQATGPRGYFLLLTKWLFSNCRPEFQIALLVLYYTVFQGGAIVLAVYVLKLFGMGITINFGLIGAFVGPLTLGALAAGYIRAATRTLSEQIRNWAVPGTFGGVAATAFWVIVEMKWRVLTLPGCAMAFASGAMLFVLLNWLTRLETKAQVKRTGT